ncbi:hypothetical protein SKAU_G00425530 [Synaphobranchus kaupii]|uniref:Integrase catalytic domain-containing protein n=1 Tax=Synaphobranchus kaupii TaxID=118154 RepID=A0A9Q1E5C7_SYNKA|nr:hypothetical protein SKAU_G00425530 [Synaphobranchus kaupii]
MDYFTKWVEARTFAKKTTANEKEALRDIFFTHGLPEIILTNQGSEFKKELTSDCPEVRVASVDPDEDSVEAFVQLRGGQDEKVLGKVICNVERAQERQKLAYRRKMKRGIKRFIITPGMEVPHKDERKKGRPGRNMDPNWSQTTYSIVRDTSGHPATSFFDLLPLGRRYRSIKCSTTRFANSFFPSAVRSLNDHNSKY